MKHKYKGLQGKGGIMAKQQFTQPTYGVTNIQQLPDQVVNQATSLKQIFDLVGKDTKDFLTTFLISELNADSGANKIGFDGLNITADNVGDALAELRQLIASVAIGTIPDNSITNDKLNPTIKVGNLGNLTTTEKATLVDATNELVSAITLKANLNSPTLTGTPTAPTPADNDDTTKIATTAYVKREANKKSNLNGGNAFTGNQTITNGDLNIVDGVQTFTNTTGTVDKRKFYFSQGISSFFLSARNDANAFVRALFEVFHDGGMRIFGNLTIDGTLSVPTTVTTITSGFASGWSGTIVVEKGLKNLCEISCSVTKTSDISDDPLTEDLIYTLPVGLRPVRTQSFLCQGMLNGEPFSNSIVKLTIHTSGQIRALRVIDGWSATGVSVATKTYYSA